ncbi:hypothetical protein POPTR_006G237050v4 [Populus trichocarpa]|uniref:Uncharacterized protein n=1 Tax=Populus trichocarpa TaxID=3694 RepID=A0ACC0SW30_POPTR|nr:hypothetical protein BDE02_06G207000 [Populus trichocarpa]KAI9393446.1 hypothetical protein POPTR_006G237050v4 [Populus trichocarpa]
MTTQSCPMLNISTEYWRPFNGGHTWLIFGIIFKHLITSAPFNGIIHHHLLIGPADLTADVSIVLEATYIDYRRHPKMTMFGLLLSLLAQLWPSLPIRPIRGLCFLPLKRGGVV